jgi:UDP-N-acetylmuramate--alanine ligase
MRLSHLNRVHMVGIGGIGMSGIAEVLLTQGFSVTGSDLSESDVTKRLEDRGAVIHVGHEPENVGHAQVLVYSSAVKPDNPEVVEAARMGIPVIRRAEMLAELMRMKSCVAVAGSHGKTSVTAMIAHLAHSAGVDATVVIGGRLSTIGTSARLGKSDLMVAEADESDRSFLLLYPTLAVITNIEWDHVDCYPSIEELREAFLHFANKVPFYGACVVNGDDPRVRAIIPRMNRRVITFGMGEDVDFRALPTESLGDSEYFEIIVRGRSLGEVRLHQKGLHSVCNALAAVAVAEEMEIPFQSVKEGLSTFPGVDRRFQKKGEVAGIQVIDDYGHHPTEVAATLNAARRKSWDGRLVLLFQPHRYTRLRAFMEPFAKALMDTDLLVVTEVYPAGEPPMEGVTGEALLDKVRELGHMDAQFCKKVEDIPELILPRLLKGDLVVVMGAGNITRVGDRLLEMLGEADAT